MKILISMFRRKSLQIGYTFFYSEIYQNTALHEEFEAGITKGFSVKLVYDLKFVGPLQFKLVAPMPEQLKITRMHFYEASLICAS